MKRRDKEIKDQDEIDYENQKIILWNMMTNILITPMLKNREQHFMVLFFYGIDMQRINVYHVVINFQVTK